MANGTREYSKHHEGKHRSASWRPGGRRQASTAGAERPQPNAARRPRNPYKVTITRMSCPERTNVGGPPLGRVCECANMLWNKFASKPQKAGVHSCRPGGPRVVGDWHGICVPCDVSRGSAPGEAARAEKLGGSGKVEGGLHPGCTCPLRQSCESHKLGSDGRDLWVDHSCRTNAGKTRLCPLVAIAIGPTRLAYNKSSQKHW